MSDSSKKSGRLAEQSSRIEEQIRESQKRKEEKQFLEELSKRVSIGREGRMDFEKQDYPAAIAKYRRFLSVTARSLNVEVSEMRPSLFDDKVRAQECLLISAILLDLCKILDKLSNTSADEERRLYQRLYVAFTVGQPFQGFAAENLRKHILYGKSIKHKGEFWGVYNSIKIQRFCVVATAVLGEDAPELDRLRRFRDGSLSRSSLGLSFIHAYYRGGPHLIPVINLIPGARSATRKAIRFFLRLVD